MTMNLVLGLSLVSAIITYFIYYTKKGLSAVKVIGAEMARDPKWLLSGQIIIILCSFVALYCRMLFIDFAKLFFVSNFFAHVFRIMFRLCWKILRTYAGLDSQRS